MTTSTVAEWAALYAAGASLRAIAAEYGYTHKTVLYAFRQHGIPTRPRNCSHYPPPLQQPWPLDRCLSCDRERRINPRSGWCHWCTTGTTPTRLSQRGYRA